MFDIKKQLDDTISIQMQQSSHLSFLDSQSKVVKMHKGVKEGQVLSSYPITLESDELFQASFTGNDYFMVWNRGGSLLSIYNTIEDKIEDIKDFWVDNLSFTRLTPLMAISNQTGSRVFGIGIDQRKLSGVDTLIFYSSGKRYQMEATRLAKHISFIVSIENSLEGSLVFVGGEHEEKAVIGAISFDEKMSPIKFIKVREDVETITQIRRMRGTNILLVGFSKNISVYKYQDRNFKSISTFEIQGCGNVLEIESSEFLIYALDNEGNVFVRFNPMGRLDANKMIQEGICKLLRIPCNRRV